MTNKTLYLCIHVALIFVTSFIFLTKGMPLDHLNAGVRMEKNIYRGCDVLSVCVKTGGQLLLRMSDLNVNACRLALWKTTCTVCIGCKV